MAHAKLVTNEMARQMRLRRARGESCIKIGREMGLSKSTVSYYTTGMHLRPDPTQPEKSGKIVVFPPRSATTLYRVSIHHVFGQPGMELEAEFDHRPVYWDMIRLCESGGLCAVDFKDAAGTRLEDRVYHGEVLMARTQMYPLAYFTVTRISGTPSIEDVLH